MVMVVMVVMVVTCNVLGACRPAESQQARGLDDGGASVGSEGEAAGNKLRTRLGRAGVGCAVDGSVRDACIRPLDVHPGVARHEA